MIIQLLTQAIIATTLFNLFPVDAKDLEQLAQDDESVEVSTYTDFNFKDVNFLSSNTAETAPVKVKKNSMGVATSAVSAIVVDQKTNAILFKKNIDVPRSIGSITKLMTAYVFLKTQPDLEKTTKLTYEDLQFGGTQNLSIEDEYKIKDILMASLISSDNTATQALVRLSNLNQGDFIATMNEEAAKMGMQRTTFVDATGLSSKNQSVVTDIVKMLNVISENQIITNATQKSNTTIYGLSGDSFNLKNTNELLDTFINSDPYKTELAKTGFLPEAGYCLGSIFSNQNKDKILVVVLGSGSKYGRFQDVKSLAVWSYNTFKWN